MENKEDLRVKRTRKLLSNALLELLNKESFDKISILDICEKAMVHRTTFYKHFSDKYDLFSYVFKEVCDDIYKRSTENKEFDSTKELYMMLAEIAFDYISENSKILKNMMESNDNGFLREMFYESIERAIKYLLQETDIKMSVPLKVVSQFYTGGFISLGIWWLDNMDKYQKEDMLKFVDKLIDENLFESEKSCK